jgi:hypothetical protein
MRLICLFCLVLPLYAQTDATAAGWLPHLTREDGGFTTQVILLNTHHEETREVVLQGYTQQGIALANAQSVTLQPGERQSLGLTDLNWSGLEVSHIQVQTPLDVTAMASFSHKTEGSMAAEVAVTTPQTLARFVPQAASPSWFDGLVAVNTTSERATLTLSAFDAQGNTLQTRQLTLTSYEKWLAVASDFFENPLTVDGYYEFRSDTPLAFLGLRGSLLLDPGVLTGLTLDHFENVPAKLTYSNQISRIINRNCAECHHDGGIAPFPMMDYEQVMVNKDWAATAVATGSMPPWTASDDCVSYKRSYAMDPAEKAMLLSWLQDESVPQGEVSRLPEPPVFIDGDWALGEPDFIFQYPEPFTFDPGPDQYRCFPVRLNNTTQLNLRALEVKADNKEIVHHVLVFISTGDVGQQNDDAEEGPGYTCFGGPETGNFQLLTGWAPGGSEVVFPDNVQMTLPPDAELIVQVHYHFSTTAGNDQTQVALYFDETEREKELLLLPLANFDFTIPPGAKDYVVSQSVTLPSIIDAEVYSVFPHMHLLGSSISVEIEHPNGQQECLVDVFDWDFDWQRVYDLENPMFLSGGSTITLNCVYDNSEDNPFNPYSPPQPVSWGEETTDEMALAFVGVTVDGISLKRPSGTPEWWPIDFADMPRGKKRAIPANVIRNPKPSSCCSPGKEDRPWSRCDLTEPAQETETAQIKDNTPPTR